jgi:ribonuclease-3
LSSLHYVFRNPGLLKTALTHRSAAGKHNERMEFLGDALLGFLVADELCARHPDAAEGPLTRVRASLVNRDTLAEIARELAVGERLLLGEGERKSGGWRRDSILANALEAIIAAIYLDGGMEACRLEVLRWFSDRLDTHLPSTSRKDAKTELQEYLQARQCALPVYKTLDEDGPAHQRIFSVECRVEGLEPIITTSESRRGGEQAAARAALNLLLGEQL